MAEIKSAPNKIGIEVGKFGGGINKDALIAKRPDDVSSTVKRLVADLAENKGTMIIALIMVVLATLFSIASPRIIGIALDDFIGEGFEKPFIICCILLFVSYSLEGIFSWADAYLMNKVSQKVIAELRKKAFEKLSKLPLSYTQKFTAGELLSRIVNDVDSVSAVLSSGVSQLLKSSITIVVTMIMMIKLSPALTVAGLILLPLRAFIIKRVLKKSKAVFSKRQKSLGELSSCGDEIVSARNAVRAYRMGPAVEEKYNALCDELQSSAEKAELMAGMTGSIAGCLTNISYALVAVIGIIMLIKGNAATLSGSGVTLGIISSMLIYTKQCSRPLNEIANQFNLLMASLAGAERVYALLDEPTENNKPEKTDSYKEITAENKSIIDKNERNNFDKRSISTDNNNRKNLLEEKPDLEFKNLSFSYDGEKMIIKDLNLIIPAGSTLALVGETGCGKTTLMNLLEKFYRPNSGAIILGGQNISEIDDKVLRSNLGIVLQDSYVFSGTIKENILLGKPDASDEEVIAAAKMASAHDFISRLHDGYDTKLTSGGSSLSLGQRQMITIARVFLKNPKLLILDEATSSLDSYSERCISQAIRNLMKDRTSIIIAHRTDTLVSADIIAVMCDGKIAEAGSYSQLLSSNGAFCRIFEK